MKEYANEEKQARYLARQHAVNLIKANVSASISRFRNRPIVYGKPSILMIEPSNVCQLHCPLCFTGQKGLQRPRGIMSLENFSKIIDDAKDSIFFLMLFFDGEPFVNRHLLDMVSLAKKSKINVLTSTNGQIDIDMPKAKEIVESGLDRIVVSMPGLTQQSYAMYGSGGDFFRAKNFIQLIAEAKKNLGSTKPILDIELLLLRSAEDDLIIAQDTMSSWGGDILTFKTIFIPEHLKDSAETWLPKNPDLSRYWKKDNRFVYRTEVGPFCKRLWQIATIYWNGDMAGCCCDQQGDRILGNVLEDGGLRTVWHGQKAQDFRAEIMYQTETPALCRNCTGGLLNFYIRSDISYIQRIRETVRIYGMHFGRSRVTK